MGIGSIMIFMVVMMWTQCAFIVFLEVLRGSAGVLIPAEKVKLFNVLI